MWEGTAQKNEAGRGASQAIYVECVGSGTKVVVVKASVQTDQVYSTCVSTCNQSGVRLLSHTLRLSLIVSLNDGQTLW